MRKTKVVLLCLGVAATYSGYKQALVMSGGDPAQVFQWTVAYAAAATLWLILVYFFIRRFFGGKGRGDTWHLAGGLAAFVGHETSDYVYGQNDGLDLAGRSAGRGDPQRAGEKPDGVRAMREKAERLLAICQDLHGLPSHILSQRRFEQVLEIQAEVENILGDLPEDEEVPT